MATIDGQLCETSTAFRSRWPPQSLDSESCRRREVDELFSRSGRDQKTTLRLRPGEDFGRQSR
jgi:hypothetical protein